MIKDIVMKIPQLNLLRFMLSKGLLQTKTRIHYCDWLDTIWAPFKCGLYNKPKLKLEKFLLYEHYSSDLTLDYIM